MSEIASPSTERGWGDVCVPIEAAPASAFAPPLSYARSVLAATGLFLAWIIGPIACLG